jgi:hypothetical protein
MNISEITVITLSYFRFDILAMSKQIARQLDGQAPSHTSARSQ